MPYLTLAWTPEQLDKMNREPFMVDFLDTFKLSPLTLATDQAIASMNKTLDRVEAEIAKP
ncbi:hypothetical protein [Neptuniibacter halophilus]|uniref:hypothetical protein n=1 Tax=Neptuniibacter halophilus TaxID=651666 RepID=UPI0025743B8D|nr:hypothetical protein [Neptuniibacter halophilus]